MHSLLHRLLKKPAVAWGLGMLAVAGAWCACHCPSFDRAFYGTLCEATDICGEGQEVVLQKHAQPAPLPTPVKEAPAVAYLSLDAATCFQSFSSMTPGPQELSVLLDKLRRAGYTTLALSAPLAWDEDSGAMARELLCHMVARFQHHAVGLRGRTAALADATPSSLARCTIPKQNIQGATTGLPSANKPFPNALADTPDQLPFRWAPDWLEDEPSTHAATARNLPLLARWNGAVVPTLPLRLAMEQHGVSPDDVQVEMGRQIRIGGTILPLDMLGCTELHGECAQKITLSDLLQEQIPLAESACVVVCQSAPASTEEQMQALSGADENRARTLACVLAELLAPSAPITEDDPALHLRVYPYPRDLNTAVWSLYLLLACMAGMAFLRRRWRCIAVAALQLPLVYAAYRLACGGLYLELSRFLAAWVVMLTVAVLPMPKRN